MEVRQFPVGHYLVWESSILRLERLPDTAIADPAEFWSALARKAGDGQRLHRAMYTADRHYRRLRALVGLAERVKRDNPQAKYCLEAGCGAGLITKYLALIFDHVDAVDACPDMIAAASSFEHVTYAVANLDTWQPEKQYDLVFCSEILEHLRDPHRTLERLVSSYVVASAPVAETLNVAGAFDAERYRKATQIGDASGHIWAWDYAGFLSLFDGMDIVEAYPIDRYAVVLAKR